MSASSLKFMRCAGTVLTSRMPRVDGMPAVAGRRITWHGSWASNEFTSKLQLRMSFKVSLIACHLTLGKPYDEAQECDCGCGSYGNCRGERRHVDRRRARCAVATGNGFTTPDDRVRRYPGKARCEVRAETDHGAVPLSVDPRHG